MYTCAFTACTFHIVAVPESFDKSLLGFIERGREEGTQAGDI